MIRSPTAPYIYYVIYLPLDTIKEVCNLGINVGQANY